MGQRVAVVLAAGKGVRMNSELPKVLIEVCGRPMIDYVLDSLFRSGVGRVLVVVGYQGELVRQRLAGRENIGFVEQTEQLGTGHAVMMCRDKLANHEGAVIVVAGDSPFLQSESVGKLLDEFDQSRPACILGTLHNDEPTGLGRIVRDKDDNFEKIVEEKDASQEQRKITEVNMSTYVFNCRDLLHALGQISDDNRQAEYYLTDCPGVLRAEGKEVLAMPVLKDCEALSINTADQLQAVEEAMRKLIS